MKHNFDVETGMNSINECDILEDTLKLLRLLGPAIMCGF